MWNDYLKLGAELERHYPNTDLISISDQKIADMLRSLPMTAEWGALPTEADYFFKVKTGWIQARRTEEPDTSIETDL